jgi:hypothetical protein
MKMYEIILGRRSAALQRLRNTDLEYTVHTFMLQSTMTIHYSAAPSCRTLRVGLPQIADSDWEGWAGRWTCVEPSLSSSQVKFCVQQNMI